MPGSTSAPTPRLSAEFTLGSMRIAALSDGAPQRVIDDFFHGVEPAEWMRALGMTDPRTPLPFNFGSFLVRSAGRTVLIDSGFGAPARTVGMPGGGELLERLTELGVEREEVDTVLHTHLHPDHCGWNVTGEEDAPEVTFPNAEVVLAQAELDYWLDDLAPDDLSAVARRNTLPYQAASRLRTFDGEYTVAPGIITVPTPGHTPGHTSVMLSSGGDHLLITGDAADHPVHLEHHDWIPDFDLDPESSRQSRGKLAALAADRNALVTGGHFPILTLGRVRRTASGFAWEYAQRP